MNAIKSVMVFAIIVFLPHTALASDYEGAESRTGKTRGEACERAKHAASVAAKAVGRKVNSINTGSCDCNEISGAETYPWECTVDWQATAKN